MDKEKNTKAYLALLTIYIVWSTTYLAIRIGVESLPPVLFTGLRWLIAGVIMVVILFLRKNKLPGKKDIIHLGIAGILLLGGGNGLVVFAEQWVPSGLTALLLTTVPLWIVGIEFLMPNSKKVNVMVWVGLVFGLIGVGMIFGTDIKSLFNPSYLKGVAALMVANICWTAGTLYLKYKKVSVQPLMGAAVQMLIAGIAITAAGLLAGESGTFHFTSSGFFAFIYLIIAGSLIAYGAYVYAVSHLPISLVSTYAYVNPVIALFLGWLILDEKITIWVVLAAFVILAGVMLVKKGSEKKI
jgi:drug/metabolite transporter (DMT)-like permease